jgi:hypothetical protein
VSVWFHSAGASIQNGASPDAILLGDLLEHLKHYKKTSIVITF